MLQKRGETCTFRKLKEAVQQINKRYIAYANIVASTYQTLFRQFEKYDLARIKTIYPEALLFDQQKHIPGLYDYTCYKSYHLIIKCNTDETCDSGSTTNDVHMSTRPPHLSPSVLLKRRQKFVENLVNVVKQHHKVGIFFYASLLICQ